MESLRSPLVAGVMMADGFQLGPPATSSSVWCWPYSQTHEGEGGGRGGVAGGEGGGGGERATG